MQALPELTHISLQDNRLTADALAQTLLATAPLTNEQFKEHIQPKRLPVALSYGGRKFLSKGKKQPPPLKVEKAGTFPSVPRVQMQFSVIRSLDISQNSCALRNPAGDALAHLLASTSALTALSLASTEYTTIPGLFSLPSCHELSAAHCCFLKAL